MVARDLGSPVGSIGSTSVRLASWRPPSGPDRAYSRNYVPVKPQDRFVPGQQFEFTADLQFRDWVIDDFSGGALVSPWWSPSDRGVRNTYWFYPDGGALRLGAEPEITQIETAGGDKTAEFVFIAETNLYVGLTSTGGVYEWNDTEWESTAITVGTGASDDMTSAAAPGTDLYVTNDNVSDIHKVTGLRQGPANTTHYAAGAADPFTFRPLVTAFNGRVYALDGNDLYTIDQSVTDTRTLVSDVNEGFALYDLAYADFSRRLSTSDVGPIWWTLSPDGYTYIHEYNVGADTTDRIGRLPYPGVLAGQLTWHLGFMFLSFIEIAPSDATASTGRGYIFYKRGGQEGIIGPILSDAGAADPDTYQSGNIYQFASGQFPLIAGAVGDDLIVLHGSNVDAYNFSKGSWGMMSHTYSGITPNVAYAAVWGNEVFIANATTSGGAKRVIRVQPSKTIIDETAGATHEPHFTTGRWHFGYPNVEKIFTTVAIDTNDLDSVDEITLAYSVDGGAFTSHATTFDGAANTYEWTLSTNSATVQGKDLDLRFTVTDRSTTDTDDLRFYRIRARSTSVQARREWQLVLDASDSSSAGHEQNDVAWLQELETLKTAKAVVQFSDPWQQYDEGTADTFDVIVEDVITPAATHSPDDMREAIVVLREIGLV